MIPEPSHCVSLCLNVHPRLLTMQSISVAKLTSLTLIHA
uniref:Uncharacterized protein n=1 Tax=Trichinella nativa TaxID=6335 RepID=A0A0V1KJ64_9BILA